MKYQSFVAAYANSEQRILLNPRQGLQFRLALKSDRLLTEPHPKTAKNFIKIHSQPSE